MRSTDKTFHRVLNVLLPAIVGGGWFASPARAATIVAPPYDPTTQTGYKDSPQPSAAPASTPGGGAIAAGGWVAKLDAGVGTPPSGLVVRFDTSGAVTDLQDLGPNSYIFTVSSPLKAINGTGMAVGELTKIVPDGISDSRAVRWDASGAITELGDLGTLNAYTTTSTALAINAAGTAVGHAQKGPPGPVPSGPTNLRAVRWDASGTAATELGNLGTDSSGRTESDAVAINDAGTAVGTAIDFSAAHPGRRAVRWNASGTAATELGVPGDLPGSYGAALAINAAGTAVGNASKVMSGRIYKGEVPVRWAASGTAATELGNLGLNSDGLVGGTAVAINDAGTAVGVIVKDLSTPTSRPRAVRWDATGTAATELGILPTSFDLHTETAPLGINAAGITVGYDRGYDSTDSYYHNTPVVWGKDAVAIDLNTLLPADSGWLLQNASGITDTNWVSGSGLFDPDGPGGQDAFTRMYLLDVSSVVPEPGTFGLVAFCGIALLRRQRRSHEYNRLRARVIGGGVRPRKNALSEHQPCWTHAIRHVAVGAVLCLTGRAGAAPMIYDLGSLGAGGTESHDVNDAGQVVGTSYAVNPISHAFRYDGIPGAGGVMRDLGTIVGVSSESHGSAINNAGQVAGWGGHAFRYDGTPGAGGVMRDLGSIGGGNSYGYGINDAGQVTGTSFTASGFHAFRYDGTPGSGGVMRDLGTLGGISEGRAVNSAGQVAGHSYLTGNTVEHAFRYDGTPGAGGVMRDLGTLGAGNSYGWDINNAGQVAGYSDTNLGGIHAFRYDGTPGSGGVMRDLGTLGGTQSYGFDLNNAGQVVGWSFNEDNFNLAFLYTGTPGAGGQMIDLDAWLDASNPAEGANWTLLQATAISNTGWIVGKGLYDPDGPGGVDYSISPFLLDASSLVPEPGLSSLFVIAAAVPLLRRARARTRSSGDLRM